MGKLLTGVFAAIALVPGSALAQAQSCIVPGSIASPAPDLPSAAQPTRILPIGGYTLALTWSPGFCRDQKENPRHAFQCGGENRFGFTLHGLWPDGTGKEWPQYCERTDILPPALIRKTMCATPSPQLIQHEWAKHGTCMKTTPEAYFARATRLYAAIRYPDIDALSRQRITVGDFKRAFARRNPGLTASAIRVTTDREGWLDELWLCLDTRYRYVRCKPGSGGARDDATLRIWRGRR